MEQEIGNISIALIRKLNPAMKGIGNDFIMDSTEYYIRMSILYSNILFVSTVLSSQCENKEVQL